MRICQVAVPRIELGFAGYGPTVEPFYYTARDTNDSIVNINFVLRIYALNVRNRS